MLAKWFKSSGINTGSVLKRSLKAGGWYWQILGAWLGASLDGHWTISSEQKPGEGPRPLPGNLLISVNMTSCIGVVIQSMLCRDRTRTQWVLIPSWDWRRLSKLARGSSLLIRFTRMMMMIVMNNDDNFSGWQWWWKFLCQLLLEKEIKAGQRKSQWCQWYDGWCHWVLHYKLFRIMSVWMSYFFIIKKVDQLNTS